MCQTTSGNRSSGGGGARGMSPRLLKARRPAFLDGRSMESMDIRLCPVVGKKYALLQTANEETGIIPSLEQLIQTDSAETDLPDTKPHKCFICSQFQESEAIGSRPKSAEDSLIQSDSATALPSIFRVLRRSTQPAHLVVMTCVIILAVFFYPADNKSTNSAVMMENTKTSDSNTALWALLYLGSFSSLFGAQMWMTFVSGLVLLFILPRHTFACVQSVLFPKYMIFSGIAAIATLVAFARLQNHPSKWSAQEYYQIIGLSINCLCPLVARILVVPSLLERIKAKVTLERAAGHGPEAGPKLTSATGALLKQCPVYNRACSRFRRLHAVVASVNIITLGFNAFHLYYLASKISFDS